jgi:hypothetical protein
MAALSQLEAENAALRQQLIVLQRKRAVGSSSRTAIALRLPTRLSS